MFNKEYSFKGSHAKKVKALTEQFDDKSTSKIFNRILDVYISAPIIGFLYGRKSDLNNEDKETAKIFDGTLIRSQNELKYNLKMILLLDSNYEQDEKKRIDRAFRYLGSKETKDEDIKLYESYVRGGVDVLYEKIIEGPSEYINNLYDFLEEFDERFNQSVSDTDIEELCKLSND